MTLVVDASVALRWLFPLTDDNAAENLVRREHPLIAPDLVLAEITNAAWKFAVFDGLPQPAAQAVVLAAEKAFDEIIPSIWLKDRALQIAIQLQHPAYDCFYIALSEQRDCPMVTADGRLLRRCRRTPFASRVRDLATWRSARRR